MFFKRIFRIKQLSARKYLSIIPSIFRGEGTEFADIKKYTIGDNSRHINRKLSAKHNNFFTNIFHQEKDIVVEIFLDINFNRKCRYEWIKNSDIIENFLHEAFLFAKKNNLALQINTPTKERNIQKNFQQEEKILQEIKNMIKKTKPIYETNLNKFLERWLQKNKKNVLCIISDFLDVSKDQKNKIKISEKDKEIWCIKLPLDPIQWTNYYANFIEENNQSIKTYPL